LCCPSSTFLDFVLGASKMSGAVTFSGTAVLPQATTPTQANVNEKILESGFDLSGNVSIPGLIEQVKSLLNEIQNLSDHIHALRETLKAQQSELAASKLRREELKNELQGLENERPQPINMSVPGGQIV